MRQSLALVLFGLLIGCGQSDNISDVQESDKSVEVIEIQNAEESIQSNTPVLVDETGENELSNSTADDSNKSEAESTIPPTLIILTESEVISGNSIQFGQRDSQNQSALNDLISLEELLLRKTPNNDFLYVSNLNTDIVVPLSGEYTIDNYTLSAETGGFFFVYSKEEDRIVVFDSMDLDLGPKEWDLSNRHLVLDFGTGLGRTMFIYDLVTGQFYSRLSLDRLFNKSGYHYHKENELFAISHEVVIGKKLEVGIDDMSKASAGILVLNPSGDEILRIEPTTEATRYIPYELGNTLIYDIQKDGELVERREVEL